MNYSLALITGASSGIGKALARRLAQENISLLLTARNQQALQELQQELSSHVSVEVFPADLQDPSSRQIVIAKMKELSPDLIINNAGFGYIGAALSHPTQDHLDVVEVNIKALLEITLESARHLKSKNKTGTILNISSVAAHFIFPFHAVYSSTKAFVTHFSLALDQELSPYGIRIFTACPGSVDTNFKERTYKEKRQRKEPSSPLAKLANWILKPMSAETAAYFIVTQLRKNKKISTFNGAYKIIAMITQYLPSKWTYAYFKKRYCP